MFSRQPRGSSRVIALALCFAIVVAAPAAAQSTKPDERAPYLDASLPVERRAADLVSRMTLEEKVSQMMNAAPGLPADDFSARWTGKLVPPVSGKYRPGATAEDGLRVYLDGKRIAEDWTEHAPTTLTGEVTLEAGRSYDLKMEYYEGRIGAVARLMWQPPASQGLPYAEVLEAAKQAEAAVLVLGLSAQLEGEEMTVREPGFLGGDRTDIFKGQPLYPFGHGLSYTRFRYDKLTFGASSVKAGEGVRVSVEVENAGSRAGDEVVQLYVTDPEASVRVPVRSLAGVERVHLRPGERRVVSFALDPRQLAVIMDDGRMVIEPGEFKITVCGKQRGFAGRADAATTATVEGRFTAAGAPTEVKR